MSLTSGWREATDIKHFAKENKTNLAKLSQQSLDNKSDI